MRFVTRAALAAILLLSAAGKAAAEVMWDKFDDQRVASSVAFATDLTWLPDGRMLVAQKEGKLLIYDKVGDGFKKRGTLLDLREIGVCENGERGLGGVQVHPDFSDTSNRWIYVFYTYNKHGTCEENSGKRGPVNRLARYWLDEGADWIDPKDGEKIFDTPALHKRYHNGGKIEFGKDGNLYVTVGEGGSKEESQSTRSLLGVMIRIKDDGGIPDENPFKGSGANCAEDGWSQNGGNCEEIYAYGLRNPFRMAMDPNTSGDKVRYFINDVGASFWEEINEGGDDIYNVNYGYPEREGPCPHSRDRNCKPDKKYKDPIHWYRHDNGGAVTAGVFVPNGIWPSEFDNSYLFGDYVWGKMYMMKKDGDPCQTCNPPTSGMNVKEFAKYPALATMRFGPYKDNQQALYYSSIEYGGVIRRIVYAGSGNRNPVANFDASQWSASPGDKINFSAEKSTDPDGDSLMYFWDLDGDAETLESTDKYPSWTYDKPGLYEVTLVVEDGKGGRDKTTAEIKIGSPPSVTMVSPWDGQTFAVGDIIQIYGESDDENVELTWEVRQHHDRHWHPFLVPSNDVNGDDLPQGAPEPEDFYAATNSHLEFILTATNEQGLTSTISRIVYPRKVYIEFETDPSGLVVKLDGTVIKTPGNATTWEGHNLNVETEDQWKDGKKYTFTSWSNNKEQKHDLYIPKAAMAPKKMTAYFNEVETNEPAEPNPVEDPVDDPDEGDNGGGDGDLCFTDVILVDNDAVNTDEWIMKSGTDVHIYQEGNGNVVVRKGSKEWPKALVWQSGTKEDEGDYYTILGADGNLVTRPGSFLRRSYDSVWASGPVSPTEGNHFLALNCDGKTISTYRGTPENPEAVLWTSPMGNMVPFDTAATDFHDFVEMGMSGHSGDCMGGPVDMKYIDDDICHQRGSRCTIGWTQPNEEVHYAFRVGFDQKVKIRLRAAGKRGGKVFNAWIHGVDGSGATFELPGSDSWTKFDDYVWSVENVPKGEHMLKVRFNDGSVNLCAVSVYTQ